MSMRKLFEGMKANISAFGQSVMGVFPTVDDPDTEIGFMYTIGNAEKHLPELLLIGNYGNTAGHILNRLGETMRRTGVVPDGIVYPWGQVDDVKPVKCIPANETAKTDYTIQAGQYLERENYKVVQVILCDKEGRFPGDPGCEPEYEVPILSIQ